MHTRTSSIERLEKRAFFDLSSITLVGPASGVESSTPTFEATGSAAPVVEWDFNYDGSTFDVNFVGRKPEIPLIDGPATQQVALRWTDAAGTFIKTKNVTVNNAAPVTAARGPNVVGESELLTLTLTANDVGDDTIQTWQIDWGDGASETVDASQTVVSHTYPTALTHPKIVVTATDEDGTWQAPFVPEPRQDLDPSFSTDGRATLSTTADAEYASQVLTLPDGSTIVVGSEPTSILVWKFRADGSLDRSFGPMGGFNRITRTAGMNSASGIVRTPGGDLVLLFSSKQSSSTVAMLVRLTPDGDIDRGFGSNGSLTRSAISEPSHIINDGDGYLIAARYSNRPAVYRLTGSFRQDTTWGTNGYASVGPNAPLGFGQRVARHGDSILLGTNNSGIGVYRFSASGALDQTFANGTGRADVIAGGAQLCAMVVDSTGRIVVGTSSAETINGVYQSVASLRRLKANGTADTFGGGSRVLMHNGKWAESLTALAFAGDDTLFGVGISPVTTSPNSGSHQMTVFAWNADGSWNTGFGDNGRLRVAFNDTLITSTATSLALSPNDHEITVIGTTRIGSETGEQDIAVARVFRPVPGAVHVLDTRPEIEATLLGPSDITVGATVQLALTLNGEPSPETVTEWHIDWRDGTSEVIAATSSEMLVTHTYAGTTVEQTYRPVITARNVDGSFGVDGPSIKVNVLPQISGFQFIVPRRSAVWANAPFIISAVVSEAVPYLDRSLLEIVNEAGEPVDLNLFFFAVTPRGTAPGPRTLTWRMTAMLPDGNYRMTIRGARIIDATGGAMVGDAVGTFFMLAGDTDYDRDVDFDDLLVLARNYNKHAGSFDGGNVDYSPDGRVNFDDLLALARNFGKTLAPIPLPAAAAATAPTKRARSIAAELV